MDPVGHGAAADGRAATGHSGFAVLLAEAIERRVAFVPGEAFFAARPQRNTMRLSFATVSPERIRTAVGILADLIRDRAPR